MSTYKVRKSSFCTKLSIQNRLPFTVIWFLSINITKHYNHKNNFFSINESGRRKTNGNTIILRQAKSRKLKVHRLLEITTTKICIKKLNFSHDLASLKELAALSNKSEASSYLEPKRPQPLSFFSAFLSKSSPFAIWSPIVFPFFGLSQKWWVCVAGFWRKWKEIRGSDISENKIQYVIVLLTFWPNRTRSWCSQQKLQKCLEPIAVLCSRAFRINGPIVLLVFEKWPVSSAEKFKFIFIWHIFLHTF